MEPEICSLLGASAGMKTRSVAVSYDLCARSSNVKV